jgi:hypothetical protein
MSGRHDYDRRIAPALAGPVIGAKLSEITAVFTGRHFTSFDRVR